MTIAIIVARGGSKRLPRKNILPFCGHPLVAWAIIQAKCSVEIDDVFVSTDDDEIEEVALKYQARVIRRPDWPDADLVAANRPFIHAMGILKGLYPDFDTVLTILPTTPLNLPGDFDKGIKLYRDYGCDWIRPLRPLRELVVVKKTHPFRCRTDIFDKGYHYLGEAGGWVVTSPEWYMRFNAEISDLDEKLNRMDEWAARESYFFPVESWQYADVDTAEEFELGEILMEHFILKGKGAKVYTDYHTEKLAEKKRIDVVMNASFGNSGQLNGLDQLH